MSQEKWDQRYLELARLVASWSRDPRAKVGAVVVRRNRVVATGFNGFPEEVLDEERRYNKKTTKLAMVVHAEENALLVAGRSAEGATIYVYGKPVCSRCAGSIIQSGIRRVVALPPKEKGRSQWDKLGIVARTMFGEAGVTYHPKKPEAAKSTKVVRKAPRDASPTPLRVGQGAKPNGRANGASRAPSPIRARPTKRAMPRHVLARSRGNGGQKKVVRSRP